MERLEALGFSGHRIELARKIDGVRNEFAHRDIEELRPSDIEQLEDIVHSLIAGRCPLADYKLELWGTPYWYPALDRKRKFVVIGSMAVSALAALPHEWALLKLQKVVR